MNLRVLSPLLVVGLFAFAAVLARRRDGPVPAWAWLAWAAGAAVACSGALLAPDLLLHWLPPLPVAAYGPMHLASGAIAGGLALATLLLPRRVALFAPVAVLAAAILLLFVASAIGEEARAWGASMPILFVGLGATAPRAASLAGAGARPWIPAAIGGAVCGILVLPALGSTLLGLVWHQVPVAQREWVVDVQPTTQEPFVLTIPFLVGRDDESQRVLDELASRMAVVAGDATLERTAEGIMVRGAGGAVRVSAGTALLGLGETRASPAEEGAWRWSGEGGARVSWSLGPGCGEQLGGTLVVGTVAPAGAGPPGSPPITPTSPSAAPCIHGD